VLHLLAIAREAGISQDQFDIDVFDAVSRKTPVIADLKPGGRYMAPDMAAAGGARLLLQRLQAGGLIEDAPTVTGKSLFEEAGLATGNAGSGRDPVGRQAAEITRRLRRALWRSGAGGLRGQAGRP
jgi:dihydroxy-acid dehydratase